jgi:NAD(P)-dependent dehydrogenase (short-subunit alcohol dehydrogenase family)
MQPNEPNPAPPVALVTGGASGIGKACAAQLRARGFRVAVADLAVTGGGIDAQAADAQLALDVTDEAAVADAVSRVTSAWGRLDAWVNAAGVVEAVRRTVDQPLADWQRVLDVNLKGTYLCCREAGRAMLALGRGGSIVNIGSVAAMVGIPGSTAYGPAKAAVATLTRNLAVEWARAGIRVNCVAPGYIETPMSAELFGDDPAVRDASLRRVPMRRLGQPDDIANAVVFLCSEQARYVTGVTLPVDGGWSALGAPAR